MKTTLKDIKNTIAIDITKLSTKEVYEIYHNEHGFKSVAYSIGIYGVTGAIVQGYTTNKLYKVTSRNSNLFIIL